MDPRWFLTASNSQSYGRVSGRFLAVRTAPATYNGETMTTLQDLKTLGAFAAEKPVRKEIHFEIDGTEYDAVIHVRQLGIGGYESIFTEDGDHRSQSAKAISEAILLGEKGDERISFEQAYRLKTALASKMLEAFNEVNAPKKPSPGKTSSSATSVLPSAE